jgi:hypothetical protein
MNAGNIDFRRKETEEYLPIPVPGVMGFAKGSYPTDYMNAPVSAL